MRYQILAISILALFSVATIAAPSGGIISIPAAYYDPQQFVVLDTFLAEKKIIAIGESAHTSSNINKTSFNLAKYMINRFGLRRLFFEKGILDSEIINKYLTGSGTLEDAMSHFRQWDSVGFASTDYADFLTALAEFNRGHFGDPVLIYGIDTWNPPWESFRLIKKFLTENKASGKETADLLADAALNCLLINGQVSSFTEFFAHPEYISFMKGPNAPGLPQSRYLRCEGSLKNLLGLIFDIKQPSETLAVVRASLRTLIIDNFEQHLKADYNEQQRWNLRDAFMFDNFMELFATFPLDQKIMIFGHNLHVTKQMSRDEWYGADGYYIGLDFKPLGYWLNKKFGNLYGVIGQSGLNVGSLFRGVDYVPNTSEESLDLLVRNIGDIALVDTQGAFAQASPFWYIQNENDASYSGMKMKPKFHFDYLISHKESPKGVPFFAR